MFSQYGFHVFPRRVSCFPVSISIRRTNVYQFNTTSSWGAQMCQIWNGHCIDNMKGFTCHIWYRINCDQKPVNNVYPCNLWYSRLTISLLTVLGFHVFPRGVSCFPLQGFMFSLVGFHVFPVLMRFGPDRWVGHHQCDAQRSFTDALTRHDERFHMPHMIHDHLWPETSKQCLFLQLMVLAVDHLVAMCHQYKLKTMKNHWCLYWTAIAGFMFSLAGFHVSR